MNGKARAIYTNTTVYGGMVMNYKQVLLNKLKTRQAVIGIIGLGYVGLPLLLRYAEEGFKVVGFDTSEYKVKQLEQRSSYIKHIPNSLIQKVFKKQCTCNIRFFVCY